MNTIVKIGKTYTVTHERKGKFVLLVEKADETWVTGTIVSGKADAILPYNVVEKGEQITVRREFCQFEKFPS